MNERATEWNNERTGKTVVQNDLEMLKKWNDGSSDFTIKTMIERKDLNNDVSFERLRPSLNVSRCVKNVLFAFANV